MRYDDLERDWYQGESSQYGSATNMVSIADILRVPPRDILTRLSYPPVCAVVRAVMADGSIPVTRNRLPIERRKSR